MKDNQAKYPQLRFKGFTDSWEQRKLGNYTTLITKGTTPREKSNDGNINFVKVENLSEGIINPTQKITETENNGYLKRSRLQQDDVLFSIAGTLGRTAIVTRSILPANTNQALAILRGYDFNQQFLLATLTGSTVKDYIRKNPTVGAQPNLSLAQLGNLEIETPSRLEQDRIGQFFNILEKTITLHQRKLAKLKELKQGYLQKLFPKNGSKFPQLRFAGFADAWEQRKLGEITISFDSQRVPLESSTRQSGSYPYYGATGVIDSVNDYIFDGEYVLLAEDGANIVTRTSPIAYLTHGKFWLNNHAHIMKVREGSDYFLLSLLEKIDYSKFNSGTAQPKLNSKTVSGLNVMIPTAQEQMHIAALLRSLDKAIALHQRKLEKLQELKKGYLQMMFC